MIVRAMLATCVGASVGSNARWDQFSRCARRVCCWLLVLAEGTHRGALHSGPGPERSVRKARDHSGRTVGQVRAFKFGRTTRVQIARTKEVDYVRRWAL